MQYMPFIFSRKPELLISGVVLSVSKWSYDLMTEMPNGCSTVSYINNNIRDRVQNFPA